MNPETCHHSPTHLHQRHNRACLCVRVWVWMCMHMCAHARARVCVCTRLYVCANVCVRVCTRACVCVCVLRRLWSRPAPDRTAGLLTITDSSRCLVLPYPLTFRSEGKSQCRATAPSQTPGPRSTGQPRASRVSQGYNKAWDKSEPRLPLIPFSNTFTGISSQTLFTQWCTFIPVQLIQIVCDE